MNVDQMLVAAQDELDQFRLEEARVLLNKVLELQPENVRALEMSAGLLLDIDEMEAAKMCLQRAVELQPDSGATKYLSLAQLLHGREAATCYQRALELTSQAAAATSEGAAGGDASQEGAPGPHQMAATLCALADLYMTDLCDEEDAEEQCKGYIARAIEVAPSSPEAHQTHASLLLVKGEMDEARAALRRSTDLWLPAYQAAREGAAASSDPLELCPLSYEMRLSTARSLIECEDWETAGQVLEGLAEEDDQVVDTWYLLGLAAFEQGGEHRKGSAPYLKRALAVGEENPEARDPEIDEHVKQMLTELGPDADVSEEEDEEGDEDEWTDDEDEEMEVEANGNG